MADGWVDETPERGFAWEAATPGLDLARAVASADLASLSGDARVSLLKALSRLSGWVSVELARATMAVDEALEAEAAKAGTSAPRGGPPDGWAAEEIAAALHIAPATASARLSAADAVVRRWPALGAAVADGRLTWAQGLVIAEGVTILDGHPAKDGRDLALVAIERVLPTAGDYPPARLRDRVAALVIRLDPTAASRRRTRATRRDTDVALWTDPDGLATVAIRGPAPDAVAIHAAIHAHATALKAHADAAAHAADAAAQAANDAAGGPAEAEGTAGGAADAEGTVGASDGAGECECEGIRTIGQWRVAAVMHALGLQPRGLPPAPIQGSDPAATANAGAPAQATPAPAPVEVRVTIDIATLLGLADDPAILDGYGAIDPELARALAADGQWVRWVTDPVNGYLLDAGDRRLPGTALARYIKARDARCSHPSCGVRAKRCDIDHVPEYRVSGHTRADQLTLTCPKHNRGRDAAGWTAEPAPWVDPLAGPEPTWTSPLGQRYRSLTDAKIDTTAPPGHAPPAPTDGPPEPPGTKPVNSHDPPDNSNLPPGVPAGVLTRLLTPIPTGAPRDDPPPF